MNDLLFMISMSLSFILPVIALAISVLIERRLEKRKQPFFGLFFPIMLCLTIYEHGLLKFQDYEISLKVGFVLLFFCYPLVLIALLYSGIRLYSVYSHQLLKASLILGIYLLASIYMHLMIFKVQGQFIKVVINIHLAKFIIMISSFLPSVYLYFDKNQQFQGFVSDEGVEDEN